MRDGLDRTDVAYIWPPTLRRPSDTATLVYLDLNHWITLAKVVSGHPGGGDYKDVYDACVRAVNARTAVFPISDSIYMEISKIGQYRQRHQLRETIEQVSRYQVVTSRVDIATHELEALLDRQVGPSPWPIQSMDYLDRGIFRAFGKKGGLRIRLSETGQDVTTEFRASYRHGPEAFDAIVAQADLDLNRAVLDGPSESEERHLRGLGWDPTAAFEVAKRRADQEQQQVRRFDLEPSWRRGRIRDVVAARELIIELEKPLGRGLAERGARLEDAFPGRDGVRRAVDAMPSFDVAVTLKTSYHLNPAHRWSPNDIHDIDALGSTLPYCDILVTDKAIAAQAHRSGLDERLKTIVISRLDELSEHL